MVFGGLHRRKENTEHLVSPRDRGKICRDSTKSQIVLFLSNLWLNWIMSEVNIRAED